jgi:hypothetical protein
VRAPARLRDAAAAVELFAAANFAFLALDIFLAHSVNDFARWEEWVPFALSLAAAPLLLLSFLAGGFRPGGARAARSLGLAVGAAAIAVGISGLLLHLDSAFFERQTIANLVYTAPFAAPLAFAGLGLLVVLDRLVDSREPDWPRWVLLLALGGFLGNLGLSLADHAQNGFFRKTEWIAVAGAAMAVGFLATALFARADRRFLRSCLAVMAVEAAVGAAGFLFHLGGNLGNPGRTLWDRFLYGAPIFAPLLFADLAVLASIAIGATLARNRVEPPAARP